jgi:hypothetical protein
MGVRLSVCSASTFDVCVAVVVAVCTWKRGSTTEGIVMRRESGRFAFVVGIVIGALFNLGLLPWVQRGSGELGSNAGYVSGNGGVEFGGGFRLGLSPLSSARAEGGGGGGGDGGGTESAMAQVFRDLGLPYVEGESILVGDEASMTYFDATTKTALVASGGALGSSYDIRLSLAYLDAVDLSAIVRASTAEAILYAGASASPGVDPQTLQAALSIVAGTLATTAGETYVSAIVLSLADVDGETRNLMIVNGIHANEATAITTASRLSASNFERQGAPALVRTGGIIDENEQFESTNCHLIQGCARCDCEYNKCARAAFGRYDASAKSLRNEYIAAQASCLITIFFGLTPAGVGLLLLCYAAATFAYINAMAALNAAYDVDKAQCNAERAACYYDTCGIVIFEI